MKNDYTITPKSNNVNYLYYLNDNIHKNKHKLWHNIARSKRQMLYGVSDHLYHQRFISENGSNNEMFRIFQSDCDIINYYINITYNCDIVENSCKIYLPYKRENISKN